MRIKYQKTKDRLQRKLFKNFQITKALERSKNWAGLEVPLMNPSLLPPYALLHWLAIYGLENNWLKTLWILVNFQKVFESTKSTWIRPSRAYSPIWPLSLPPLSIPSLTDPFSVSISICVQIPFFGDKILTAARRGKNGQHGGEPSQNNRQRPRGQTNLYREKERKEGPFCRKSIRMSPLTLEIFWGFTGMLWINPTLRY